MKSTPKRKVVKYYPIVTMKTTAKRQSTVKRVKNQKRLKIIQEMKQAATKKPMKKTQTSMKRKTVN